MLSTLFTMGIYVAGVFPGHSQHRPVHQHSRSTIIRNPLYVLPNFHNFDVIGRAAHGFAIPHALIGQNTLYTVLYSALVLIASAAVFSGRNLK